MNIKKIAFLGCSLTCKGTAKGLNKTGDAIAKLSESIYSLQKRVENKSEYFAGKVIREAIKDLAKAELKKKEKYNSNDRKYLTILANNC